VAVLVLAVEVLALIEDAMLLLGRRIEVEVVEVVVVIHIMLLGPEVPGL
jgi:hypothetical protein